VDEQLFRPNGRHVNMISRWLIVAIIFGVLYFALRFSGREPEIAIPGIFIMLCFAWFRKEPVGIAVSVPQKKLAYCYRNGLGQKKIIQVDLRTAGGSYEYQSYSNTSYGWRLLLYNGHYFKNRVAVMQNEKNGFSKKQLDQIVTLIHQCRSK